MVCVLRKRVRVCVCACACQARLAKSPATASSHASPRLEMVLPVRGCCLSALFISGAAGSCETRTDGRREEHGVL
jgi:hypothetical protein